MSVDNGKVCCNCRHCIRIKEIPNGWVWCRCNQHNMFLPYIKVMTGWCRHWANDNKKWEEVEE